MGKPTLASAALALLGVLAVAGVADADEHALPACVQLIDPPARVAPTRAFGDAPAESAAAARVVATLTQVRTTIRQTRYEHTTHVRASDGLYLWDCSGMAAWILSRAAPRAFASVGGERPVARDFFRAIARSPTSRARGGWRQLDRLEDARPGDVLSWVRPRDFPSHNTGHVAFVLAAPVKVLSRDDAWAVRVADATSFGHENDTRPQGSDGGYGEGTLLFLVDAQGRGTAYGWFGSYSDAVIVTPIVVGRPVS